MTKPSEQEKWRKFLQPVTTGLMAMMTTKILVILSALNLITFLAFVLEEV